MCRVVCCESSVIGSTRKHIVFYILSGVAICSLRLLIARPLPLAAPPGLRVSCVERRVVCSVVSMLCISYLRSRRSCRNSCRVPCAIDCTSNTLFSLHCSGPPFNPFTRAFSSMVSNSFTCPHMITSSLQHDVLPP